MKPDNWTLVRGARQLLTLHRHGGSRRGPELGELGVIVDGSVLLRNGLIEAVGPTRRIENLAGARYADEIDAAGRVVMPAFIDPEACLVPVPGHRGESTASVRAVPATRLEAQADALIKTMARHGTATIGALSGYGGDSSDELKILRALHARNQRPLDIISVHYRRELPADGDPGEELLQCVARRKLAGIAAVKCGDGCIPWLSAETWWSTARAAGLAVRLEMSPQHDGELVEMAVKRKALSISMAGPYRLPEIEWISDSSTFTILLPQLLAETGCAGSARELINSGALVALGTGLSPVCGGTASMQYVLQLACGMLGLSIAEAISAATINAAWALGVGAQTGSLEHHKRGDLILLNASDYRDLQLLSGTNLTHLMLKRGVVLFKEEFSGWPLPT